MFRALIERFIHGKVSSVVETSAQAVSDACNFYAKIFTSISSLVSDMRFKVCIVNHVKNILTSPEGQEIIAAFSNLVETINKHGPAIEKRFLEMGQELTPIVKEHIKEEELNELFTKLEKSSRLANDCLSSIFRSPKDNQ